MQFYAPETGYGEIPSDRFAQQSVECYSYRKTGLDAFRRIQHAIQQCLDSGDAPHVALSAEDVQLVQEVLARMKICPGLVKDDDAGLYRRVFNGVNQMLSMWLTTAAPDYVWGPVSLMYLTRGDRTVTLFGEDHSYTPNDSPVESACAKLGFAAGKRGMHVSILLSEWLKRVCVPVDLFIEMGMVRGSALDVPRRRAFLDDVRLKFIGCERAKYKTHACTLDGASRVHMIDVSRGSMDTTKYVLQLPSFRGLCRYGVSLATYYEKMYKPADTRFFTQPHEDVWWPPELDILKTRFFEECSALVLELLFAPPKSIGVGVAKICKNWFAMLNSVSSEDAAKVWQVLSQTWVEKLWTFVLRSFYESLLSAYGSYLKLNIYAPFDMSWVKFSAKTMEGYADYSLQFNTIFMDMYALARMLKTPQGETRAPQHIVFYGGNYHATRYSHVFESIGFQMQREFNSEYSEFGASAAPCLPFSLLVPVFNKTGAAFRLETCKLMPFPSPLPVGGGGYASHTFGIRSLY